MGQWIQSEELYAGGIAQAISDCDPVKGNTTLREALNGLVRNVTKHQLSALQHAHRFFVMEAVKENGQMLQYASEALRGDISIVMEAVKQDRKALLFASEEGLGEFSTLEELDMSCCELLSLPEWLES